MNWKRWPKKMRHEQPKNMIKQMKALQNITDAQNAFRNEKSGVQ